MGETKKDTNAKKRTKTAGRRKLTKESAAASNELINYRKRMVMAMAEIQYVSLSPFFDNNSNILAPVVQRPDNFIRWIRHYSGSKIYFTLNVIQGFRTLPNLTVVRVCIFACTRGNTEIFTQIETCRIVTYLRYKVIRPSNNWSLMSNRNKSLLRRTPFKCNITVVFVG